MQAALTWRKLSSQPEKRLLGSHGIEYWAIREEKVWHQGRKLAAADPATFEVLDQQDFIARDAFSVFYAWSRLPQIDRASFQKIGLYWKDDHHVYFEYETSFKALQDADAQSFRYLGGSYGADAQSAWYYGRRMKNCTRSTGLRVIAENDLYATDGEKIYFDGKPLSGVDASRWRIVNQDFSCDDKNVYYAERKLPRADLPSWQHLHRAWSKDRSHVFHMNFVEKDLSPDGFDVSQAMKR